MLDTDTKRRIDTCRDMLVGKLPNPQSQVEQITIALIYKFMDDMDAQAEELGGKRKFFAGDFAKYSWVKLVAPDRGGFDMLALYSEAIQKMNENTGIPPLFRDIFKNAYLPYRDPETLRSFLKEINGFSYDHSERLGDAFEYLLSILGSQGDAGQFRTPRHIIDFMVDVIDPKKGESILDPACGTAGFLISSYKHILKHNSKDFQDKNDLEGYQKQGVPLEQVTLDSPLHYKGDLLTPDDRQRLASQIKGYDISPDMVRLSLVNLYLHGFNNPSIVEYDTLTSEDRWNEYTDIILANPPFMSPKGGIKPHKRFSIQSKRSEVLFVDYIAEHLSPTGRAAIIVPEGIIFQSGTAYKQLRKMLVDSYLVAVISLPAGVFNPYSGVKTSILILDKRLAKKTASVLFVKIDNDGFNLGAQRRPIDKNDLPAAAINIKAWMNAVRNDEAFDLEGIANLQAVEKTKIAENGEWNLSCDRYKTNENQVTAWPIVELNSICDVRDGTHDSPQYIQDGYPLITSKNLKNGVIDFEGANLISKADLDAINKRSKVHDGDILMPMIGTIGNPIIAKVDREFAVKNVALIKFYPESKIDRQFLKSVLDSSHIQEKLVNSSSGSTQKFISLGQIRKLLIPLPPLEVQKEIVAEIEGYQKIIDGARQVVESYKPRIQVEDDWPMVELVNIIDELESGVSVNSINKHSEKDQIGVLKTSCVTTGVFQPEEHKTVINDELERVRCPVRKNSIIISRMNTEALVGANAYVNQEYPYLFLPDRLWQTVISRPDVEVRYIQSVLASDSYRKQISALCGGTSGSMKNISKPRLLSIKIPLPEIDKQHAIIAMLEKEQQLVNANKELIQIFEAKIKAAINRVWGED